MSWLSGSIGTNLKPIIVKTFIQNQVRQRYVAFLKLGILDLEENRIFESKQFETNIIAYSSASFVVYPQKPVQYINITFEIDSSENKPK